MNWTFTQRQIYRSEVSCSFFFSVTLYILKDNKLLTFYILLNLCLFWKRHQLFAVTFSPIQEPLSETTYISACTGICTCALVHENMWILFNFLSLCVGVCVLVWFHSYIYCWGIPFCPYIFLYTLEFIYVENLKIIHALRYLLSLLLFCCCCCYLLFKLLFKYTHFEQNVLLKPGVIKKNL